MMTRNTIPKKPTPKETGTFALLLLLSVFVLEYTGLGKQIPVFNVIKYPLLVNFCLLLYCTLRAKGDNVLRFRQSKILLTFLVLTFLSIFHAMFTMYVVEIFKGQIGYFIMFVNLYYLADTRRKIRMVCWTMVLSHAYLVLVNLDRFFQAQRAAVFNTGYFLGDGNDFAWSLVTFLPLAIYLALSSQKLLPKTAALAIMLLMVFGIFGTTSRGAFLGLAASVTYLVGNSSKRGLAVTVAVTGCLVALLLLPPSYLGRISSIGNYEAENSAQARLVAWKAATQMAVDRPIGVGAGNFPSVYGRKYVHRYESQLTWGGKRWIAVHSIYFLVLAEYGFLGLFLLLWLGWSMFRTNHRQIQTFRKQTNNSADSQAILFMNTSLIGFFACGIFLGGLNYPHIFILTALMTRTGYLLNLEKWG